MPSNKCKRVESLEQRTHAGKGVIAIVDVRDLPAEEASARIAAKHIELAAQHAATLIILRHEGE